MDRIAKSNHEFDHNFDHKFNHNFDHKLDHNFDHGFDHNLDQTCALNAPDLSKTLLFCTKGGSERQSGPFLPLFSHGLHGFHGPKVDLINKYYGVHGSRVDRIDNYHGFRGPKVDRIDNYHGLHGPIVDPIEKNHGFTRSKGGSWANLGSFCPKPPIEIYI